MSTKIFMAACFVPIALLMFGMLYYEGKRKGNILLGVTLWPGAETGDAVQKVKMRYQREMLGWLAVSLVSLAGTCLIEPSSIGLSLQMLWVIFVIIIFFVPHFTGNRRLKEAKREWLAARECGKQETEGETEGEFFTEEASVSAKRQVDVTAAAKTPPRPFWKAGFAGALLGVVPVIGELFFMGESFYGWWTEFMLLSLAAGGLLILWVQWHFWRMRTDVVSWRSEVNQQVARVRQYQWGRFWCLAVWENSIMLFAFWYSMHRPRLTLPVVLLGTLALTVLLVIQAFFTEKNIRKAYEAYADPIYWDETEDEHWLGGMFYYNKKDNRFMVNKRVGIGTTINLAKTSGKVFSIVAGLATLAVMLWSAILLPAYDFVPVSLEVTQGQVVSRQFGEEYAIPLEDIDEAELLWELPGMSKRVGSATDTIYKGKFMEKDYTSCQVCVRRTQPPFVKIFTKEGEVYYLNDEEGEDTQEVFEVISRKQ